VKIFDLKSKEQPALAINRSLLICPKIFESYVQMKILMCSLLSICLDLWLTTHLSLFNHRFTFLGLSWWDLSLENQLNIHCFPQVSIDKAVKTNREYIGFQYLKDYRYEI